MAQKIQRMPMWLGKYPMLDTTPEQEADLEMRAAIHEHHNKLPRHEAEARAHADYRSDKIMEAAAHHLNGMNAAAAAGNKDAAKQHAYHYALAMHQLGHKDLVTPPDEVADRAKNTPSEDIARFKGHKADIYSLPEQPDDDIQRGGNEAQVKGRAALKKAIEDTNALFQKQGYQNHPVGATGGGIPHDQAKQDELIDTAYHAAWPQEQKYAKLVTGTKASIVPPEHHQASAPPAAGAEGSILAGALVARQMIRHLIRKHAARNLGKAEAEPPVCVSCGAPFNPGAGHQADAPVCKPCMQNFINWMMGLNKAEGILDEYPKDHQLGMEVPAGGSNCAKCSYVSEDLKKCGNHVFQEWNGGDKLPKPAFKYCCDLYEIKKK